MQLHQILLRVALVVDFKHLVGMKIVGGKKKLMNLNKLTFDLLEWNGDAGTSSMICDIWSQ